MNSYRVVSESVTEGHSDKVCDIICDAIVDEYLRIDNGARVGCEALVTDNLVVLSGEVLSLGNIDVEKVVRDNIRDIGYVNRDMGFDYKSLKIVDQIAVEYPMLGMEKGANDQGIVYGYAVRETNEYMPISITLANRLSKRLAEVRKQDSLEYLRPDGKTMVYMKLNDDKPKIKVIVISANHNCGVELERLRDDIYTQVIEKTIPSMLIDRDTKVMINPIGRFEIGGPYGDTGVSGRKLMVDSYGGCSRHGGGALSGKDIYKVDRGGAYIARYLAKNIVASRLADRCEVSMAYAIGGSRPILIGINTWNTGRVKDIDIERIIDKCFDLSMEGIAELFNGHGKAYNFKDTAAYGHFGRDDILFPWERLDSVDLLKSYL